MPELVEKGAKEFPVVMKKEAEEQRKLVVRHAQEF